MAPLVDKVLGSPRVTGVLLPISGEKRLLRHILEESFPSIWVVLLQPSLNIKHLLTSASNEWALEQFHRD
jgi:hypothetical protein